MAKASFDIRLEGYAPANRDAVVELVNQATGQQVTRKPFLDGSLLVRDLDPGSWEMTVRHPNLINAIDRRVIRLFPQPLPTRVPVIVPPDLFRDTPIRDIPDADLAPVQQTAAAAAANVAPLAGKAPGEVIRAEDWNVLAAAVADLARTIGELTQIVSPRGHDHPEIAEKIDEVQGNIRRFTDSFGRSLLELRREIESQNLRAKITDVLDRGGAAPEIRDRLLSRVAQLEASTLTPTPTWTNTIANHGNAMIREVLDLANAQTTGADDFLATPEVATTMTILQNFAGAGGQTQPEQELQLYRRGAAVAGPAFFGVVRT
ncbi:hypothetical protein GCM10009826_11140 [Humibacillus xanthopallidus]